MPPVVEYTTPPSDLSEFMDAFHEGEEVRFHWIEDVYGDAEVPVLAAWLVDDPELMLMSVEKAAMFTTAEHDAEWRKAMLEEIRSIEENKTWDLVDPPVG